MLGHISKHKRERKWERDAMDLRYERFLSNILFFLKIKSINATLKSSGIFLK